MIEINSRYEYDYCINRGYQPLIDWRLFKMKIDLRIEIQHELFVTADFSKANDRFYHYVWDNSPHYCIETSKRLHNYSAVFISHIITKGSNRAMAIDPRNANVLCFEMHNKWEYGKRKEMNVYPMNQLIIKMLKHDYRR